jgi:hypothetical protein
MKLRNKETGEETIYIEGETFYNENIWELVEGEISEDEIYFDEKINNKDENN